VVEGESRKVGDIVMPAPVWAAIDGGVALELVDLLARGREGELVELLLARYYDPLYRHSEKGRGYAARFDASDPAVAAAEIAAWIARRMESAGEPAQAAPVRVDL
jgi:hypothetical protein